MTLYRKSRDEVNTIETLNIQDAIDLLEEHPDRARNIIFELRPHFLQRAEPGLFVGGTVASEIRFLETLARVAPQAIPDLLDAWHEVNTKPLKILQVILGAGATHPEVIRLGAASMRSWKGSEGRELRKYLIDQGFKRIIREDDFTLLGIALEQGNAILHDEFQGYVAGTAAGGAGRSSGNAVLAAMVEIGETRKSRDFMPRRLRRMPEPEVIVERGAKLLIQLHERGFSLTAPCASFTEEKTGVVVRATPMELASFMHKDTEQMGEIAGSALALALMETKQVRLDTQCQDPALLATLQKSTFLSTAIRRQALLDHVDQSTSDTSRQKRPNSRM